MPCWTAGRASLVQGSANQVPVIKAAPLPEKLSSFVVSYLCDPIMRSLIVVFDWEPAKNVTGYNLYRNGVLLHVFGPNVRNFQDREAPLEMELVYTLVPFNDYGTSPSRTATISPCGD
jgi:hypothetical protein